MNDVHDRERICLLTESRPAAVLSFCRLRMVDSVELVDATDLLSALPVSSSGNIMG
jgi:hypothetical protein